tara:strand:+ start:2314 stop:2760 length:447 start_codon:yes stop_codon:yes gene_type:complete
MQNIGTRKEVMNGGAKKTSGGLKKKDLIINKRGKIVSKKLHNLAVRRMQHGGVIYYRIKSNDEIKLLKKTLNDIKNEEDIVFLNNNKSEREIHLGKYNLGSLENKWELITGVDYNKAYRHKYIKIQNVQDNTTIKLSPFQLETFCEMI